MESLSPISTKFSNPNSLPSLLSPFSTFNHRRKSRKCKAWTLSFPCFSSYKTVATQCKVQLNDRDLVKFDSDWRRSIGRGLFGVAAAAAAMFSVCCDSPALAESLTVAFPVSRAREVMCLIVLLLWVVLFLRFVCWVQLDAFCQVNTVQRTLVETWGLIRETFIDPTFNHQGTDLSEVRNNYYYYFSSTRIWRELWNCRLGSEITTDNGGNVSPENGGCSLQQN